MDADPQSRRSTQRGGIAVVAVLLVVLPLVLAYRMRNHETTSSVHIDNGLVGRRVGVPMSNSANRFHLSPDLALAHGAAEVAVRGALGTTTGAKDFAIDYQIVETPPTVAGHASSTVPCARGGAVVGKSGGAVEATPMMCTVAPIQNTTVSGHGVVNVNPKRMVTSAHINSGMDVAVRVDDSHVWESIDGPSDLAPRGDGAGQTGSSLSGFASLTESTLGNRAGAVAMLAMASPNGYLSLESDALDGAAPDGTSTVDGTPVTVFQVGVDLPRLLDLPGLSTDGNTAITEALQLLDSERYTTTRADVSVDAAGYIRRMVAEHRFADGGTVAFAVTLSRIGCAGTVGLPGEPPPPVTATNCVSPDDPSRAPTTTTLPTASLPTPTPTPTPPTTLTTPTTVSSAPPTSSVTSSVSPTTSTSAHD